MSSLSQKRNRKVATKLSERKLESLVVQEIRRKVIYCGVHARFQLSTSPKLHGTEVTYGLRQFVNQFILKPQKTPL